MSLPRRRNKNASTGLLLRRFSGKPAKRPIFRKVNGFSLDRRMRAWESQTVDRFGWCRRLVIMCNPVRLHGGPGFFLLAFRTNAARLRHRMITTEEDQGAFPALSLRRKETATSVTVWVESLKIHGAGPTAFSAMACLAMAYRAKFGSTHEASEAAL